MKRFKIILFALFSVFVVCSTYAMEPKSFTLDNINKACIESLKFLVKNGKISARQSQIYLKRFQEEVFFEQLSLQDLTSTKKSNDVIEKLESLREVAREAGGAKRVCIQDSIVKKIKEALRAKRKITIVDLVQNVVCEIFGRENLSADAKRIIKDELDLTGDVKLQLDTSNFSPILWHITNAIIYLYVSVWRTCDCFLEEFCKCAKIDKMETSVEVKFICNILKNERINALMCDDVMMCALFPVNKEELVEIIKSLFFKMKRLLPLWSKDGDSDIIGITNRFDLLKINTQSTFEYSLERVKKSLAKCESLKVFYGILIHCLWEHYKRE